MVMVASARERIAALPHDLVVLDVGGWADPHPRADWVIDLMPYETRGLYAAAVDPTRERFDASRWVRRDICDRAPWPFADGQFDFVICSQTLEDIRDPIWVCEEIQRIGRAGYVEVPTRLAEQSAGVEGPWAGWSHHRWICDLDDRPGITFTFKSHVVHQPGRHLPDAFGRALTTDRLAAGFFWEGRFDASERIHLEAEPLEAELRATVEAHRTEVPPAPRGLLRRVLRR